MTLKRNDRGKISTKNVWDSNKEENLVELMQLCCYYDYTKKNIVWSCDSCLALMWLLAELYAALVKGHFQ